MCDLCCCENITVCASVCNKAFNVIEPTTIDNCDWKVKQ